MDQLGKTEWSETTQTCSVFNSIQIKVVQDETGFKEFPQHYIIDVKKSAKRELWQLPQSTMDVSHSGKISFNFYVSVQHATYVNIDSDD